MADYNINAVTRRVVFSGSAGVGPYAFTFEVLAQTDIAVYKNSTKLTLTTDYTVTINANGTGSVTLIVAATSSDTITIIGSRAIERTTDFVTAGDLLASSLNEQLDSQIVMIQQLAEENKRTLKAPAYDPADVADGGTANLTLPAASARAGKVLSFDSSGNPQAYEIGAPIGASYTISDFSGLFDGNQTAFLLDINGDNLGTTVNDNGFWIIALNGVIQTESVDYNITVDSSDIARVVFTTAPESLDTCYAVFIRLYEGGVPDAGAGGGGGGGEADPTSYIEIVTSNPASGEYDGQTIYNTTDGAIYIWKASTSEWLDIFQSFTPDAPDAITVVSSLPGSGTAGQVVYLSTDEKLYEWDAGSSQWVAIVLTNDTSATVADGSITTAKFAQGITPVEIVATLPSSGNFEGRMAYLTTDNKLYRYEGATWTAAVAGSDLTGSVDGSLLTANSIAAGVIQAGAISATELAANAVSTAKLAAGAVTTDKITANAVIADKIAANAVTSDKIIANAISSGKIQAGAIGADQIAAGVISTSKINANDFLLGTGQIANAAITNAKIATAAVDTLEIASEAVIVPKVYYNQSGYTGSGSTINIPSLSFTLPVATKAFILFNANQGYSGSIPDTTLIMYLNGTVISGVSNGGSSPSTSPTLAGSASLSAGTHTVYVSWYGASSAVTIGNISLTVLGAMR